MNRFIAYRSLSALVMTWFFVATIFADGANITDLWTSMTTIHFEEGISSSTTDLGNVSTAGHTTRQDVGHQKQESLIHVVFDQDSPSLAASDFTTEHAATIHPTREKAVSIEVPSVSSLYLRHCALLI